MKIGVAYPQYELKGDPDAVGRIGKEVEALGYDYLLAYDHVLAATHDRVPKLTGPYTENEAFHDPFVMFAYIAAVTQRLEFATGILILPQRQTALVARQAADLDLLSHERLRLGVGVGWNYVEYDALGQDFHSRGRRIEEQIKYLRRLWSEHLLTFEGEFDKVDRANLLPRPRRQIPIWIGGFAEPAFRRAAHLGDGFIFTHPFSRAEHGWSRVQHYLNEAGRSVDKFGREYLAQDASSQAVAESLKRWRDMGGTHGSFSTMGKGFSTIEHHLTFASEVRNLLA